MSQDDEGQQGREFSRAPVVTDDGAAARRHLAELARDDRADLIHDPNLRAIAVFVKIVAKEVIVPIIQSDDEADKRKHASMSASLQYTDNELKRRHVRALFESIPTIALAFIVAIGGVLVAVFVEHGAAAGIALLFAAAAMLKNTGSPKALKSAGKQHDSNGDA